jgi:RNA polymerase sigma factor (sigma-70 family)
MSEFALRRSTHLVETYYAELRAFAYRRIGNAAMADDLVQEACLRFANAGEAKRENPRAFLYRIVGNLVIDQQRMERTRRSVAIDKTAGIADPAPDAERGLLAKQRLAILSEAIAELPPRCRECFVMCRFDDLDPDEIARRMGISRNMVEKHLRVALAHCAKRLHACD